MADIIHKNQTNSSVATHINERWKMAGAMRDREHEEERAVKLTPPPVELTVEEIESACKYAYEITAGCFPYGDILKSTKKPSASHRMYKLHENSGFLLRDKGIWVNGLDGIDREYPFANKWDSSRSRQVGPVGADTQEEKGYWIAREKLARGLSEMHGAAADSHFAVIAFRAFKDAFPTIPIAHIKIKLSKRDDKTKRDPREFLIVGLDTEECKLIDEFNFDRFVARVEKDEKIRICDFTNARQPYFSAKYIKVYLDALINEKDLARIKKGEWEVPEAPIGLNKRKKENEYRIVSLEARMHLSNSPNTSHDTSHTSDTKDTEKPKALPPEKPCANPLAIFYAPKPPRSSHAKGTYASRAAAVPSHVRGTETNRVAVVPRIEGQKVAVGSNFLDASYHGTGMMKPKRGGLLGSGAASGTRHGTGTLSRRRESPFTSETASRFSALPAISVVKPDIEYVQIVGLDKEGEDSFLDGKFEELNDCVENGQFAGAIVTVSKTDEEDVTWSLEHFLQDSIKKRDRVKFTLESRGCSVGDSSIRMIREEMLISKKAVEAEVEAPSPRRRRKVRIRPRTSKPASSADTASSNSALDDVTPLAQEVGPLTKISSHSSRESLASSLNRWGILPSISKDSATSQAALKQTKLQTEDYQSA